MQKRQLEEQKKELNTIYSTIKQEKEKLSNAVLEANEKERMLKSLVNLQIDKQKEFENAKIKLEHLNSQIEEEKNNLLVKESIIADQKNKILIFGALFIIILILGINGIRQNLLLKNLSQIDTLSGLYNRRFMNKKIEEEISKYKRYKIPFSVLLIDVDFFKKINDTYGHDKGDFVIKRISNLLKQNIRDSDICARWGGEEFLILVPNNNLDGALILANNLKELIEKNNFEIKENVTISIGVSTFDENSSQEKLLKSADIALYKAKENGRNRTEFI